MPLHFSIWADKSCRRSAMLTEVRVDESAQPRKDVQSDAEKGTDPGLAEAMRAWVHRLLDRNDTDVHLVRMAPCAVVLSKITSRLVERNLSTFSPLRPVLSAF